MAEKLTYTSEGTVFLKVQEVQHKRIEVQAL